MGWEEETEEYSRAEKRGIRAIQILSFYFVLLKNKCLHFWNNWIKLM